MADVKPLVFTSDFEFREEIQAADRLDLPGGATLGGALDMNSNQINEVSDGTSAQDAVTLSQLQSAVAGKDYKDNVVAVADSDQTLSGLPTIDGVGPLTAGQRVLLTAQAPASENGIWEVAAGAWSRPSDFPAAGSAEGAAVYSTGGTLYENTEWVASADSPSDVIDTDDPGFVRSAANIAEGDGINISGGVTIAVDLATNPGLQFTSSALDLLLKDATLSKDASGLFVVGVPSLFEIGGTAVGANVTAANLDELTGGGATTLHSHAGADAAQRIQETVTANEAISIGDPVEWGAVADKMRRCEADTGAKVDAIGVAVSAAAGDGNTFDMVRLGLAAGAIAGATVGDRFYLDTNGGLTQGAASLASGDHIVYMGHAKNATDLDVRVQYIGRKA